MIFTHYAISISEHSYLFRIFHYKVVQEKEQNIINNICFISCLLLYVFRVYTSQYACPSMHFTLCFSHYAFHSIHLTVWISHNAFKTMHLTLCFSHYSFHTMHFTLCNSHYAFYTRHFTLCLLNSIFENEKKKTLKGSFSKNILKPSQPMRCSLGSILRFSQCLIFIWHVQIIIYDQTYIKVK